MVERARGLSGVLRERQRSLAQALDAAADADVVSTLEAEVARLSEELESAGREAADLAPEQDGLLAAESELSTELDEHLATRGDGSALRQAEEAVTVARGQLASLEHALERDRRTLDQLVARQGAAERRAALLEGEDHELGERLAETEQGRHRLQAERATTEAAHLAASRRVEVAEEALRQAEQEHARSQARADALERALDEARGAAGAELLAGVDGVVGTLLDLVEVDSGWEEAFEAAAGASLAAVVVSGSEPARAALSRLRQGGATGAVLALTEASASVFSVAGGPSGGADTPLGTESIRRHVRPRRTGGGLRGLDGVLDTLLAGSCCAQNGWSEAIDLALARPDLVVVTRDGDRFSSTGWRVRAAGGVVTAVVVDEARARAEVAKVAAAGAAVERATARAEVEATREATAEAVRSDDRNEVAHQTARAGRQRVANERSPLSVELEEINRNHAELEERIARDNARLSELLSGLPALEEARARAAERVAAARQERRRIDERIAEAAARRSEWEVRSAGLVERRRVLAERLSEVERRLTGHAEERREAAERRRRLEAEATAIERLLIVVAAAQATLDSALAELRERHRRQLEALRAAASSCSAADRRRRRSSRRAPPARSASSWRRWRSRSSASAESNVAWAAATAIERLLIVVASASNRRRRSAASRRSSACPVRRRSTSARRSARTRRRSTRPADRTSHSLRRADASAIRSSMRRRSWRAAATRSAARARASSSAGSPVRSSDRRALSRTIRSSSSAWLRLISSSSAFSGDRSLATRWRPARAVWWATSLRSSVRTPSAAASRVASTSARATARSTAASAAATLATSARARASSTTAAVTTPPAARTLHPVDEKRSPSRVTTTRSGRARARSIASDQPFWAQQEPASRVSRTPSSPRGPPPPVRGRTCRRIDSVPEGASAPPGASPVTERAEASVRARTAPVAPPRRSLDRAARAGSLPETTTAARDAPAAASKASSQPRSTSTRSSRVPTTPSTPASSSAPVAPRASSRARSRASARATERACSCSACRSASSATSNRRVERPWAASVSATTACRRWRACSVSARRSPSSWSSPSRTAARRSVEANRAVSWSRDRRSRSRACSSEATCPRATVTASSAWRSSVPSPHASRCSSSSAAIAASTLTRAWSSGASA